MKVFSTLPQAAPIPDLAHPTCQCAVVNTFFQSRPPSLLFIFPVEIYLAAFSIGLMRHRCFKADFPLVLCFKSFLNLDRLGFFKVIFLVRGCCTVAVRVVFSTLGFELDFIPNLSLLLHGQAFPFGYVYLCERKHMAEEFFSNVF